MKFLYAILGIFMAFIMSIIAHKIYFSLTGRYYSFEHGSGPFSGIYFDIVTFTPLIGAVFGWKYWTTKRKSFLSFFPIYFIVMYVFYWYSAVYAGYPLFN